MRIISFISFVFILLLNMLNVAKANDEFVGATASASAGIVYRSDVASACVRYGEATCKEIYGNDWEAEMDFERKVHDEGKNKWWSLAEVVYSGKANRIIAESYVEGVEEVFVPVVSNGLTYSGEAIGSIPIPQAIVLGEGLQKGGEGVKTAFEGAKTLSEGLIYLTNGSNEEELRIAARDFLNAGKDLGIEFLPLDSLSGLGKVVDGRLKKWVNPTSKVWRTKFAENLAKQGVSDALEGGLSWLLGVPIDKLTEANSEESNQDGEVSGGGDINADPTRQEDASTYAQRQVKAALEHFAKAARTMSSVEFERGVQCLKVAQWVATEKNRAFMIDIASGSGMAGGKGATEFSDHQLSLLRIAFDFATSVTFHNPEGMINAVKNAKTYLDQFLAAKSDSPQGESAENQFAGAKAYASAKFSENGTGDDDSNTENSLTSDIADLGAGESEETEVTKGWSSSTGYNLPTAGVKKDIVDLANDFVEQGAGQSEICTGGSCWLTDVAGGDGQKMRNAIEAFDNWRKEHPEEAISDEIKVEMKNKFAGSSYGVNQKTSLVDKIISTYEGGNVDLPGSDDETLQYLGVRKQCLEWAMHVATSSGGNKINYQNTGSNSVDIDDVKPGMGLYDLSNHAMIIVDVEYDDDGKPLNIKVAESNWASNWSNPIGAVPWDRAVSTRTMTAKKASNYVIVDYGTAE
ncbi:MAG: hypothetical protein ABIE74_04905 [Pseudomonadota bacterium]